MITVTLKINVSFRSLEDWILNNGVYKSSQFINKDGYYKDSPNFAFMGFVQDPNNLNRFTAIAIYTPERKDDPVEHVPEAIILNVFSETTNRQRVTVECGNWDNYLWFVSCFVAAVMDEWPRHARVSAWSVFKINPSEEREPERLFQEHMEKLKSSSAELAPIEDGFIDPDDEDEPAAVNKNGEGTVIQMEPMESAQAMPAYEEAKYPSSLNAEDENRLRQLWADNSLSIKTIARKLSIGEERIKQYKYMYQLSDRKRGRKSSKKLST